LPSTELNADTAIRPEVRDLLGQGKETLRQAMEPTPLTFAAGTCLMQMGEPHEFLYAVEDGWLARARTIADGRRQIIVVFLPGDVCGVKTLFMNRQPDAIEALCPAAVRRIHHRDACALATREFGVALFLAWQLAQDERHLHDWNLRLGRANAEERIAALILEFRDRLAGKGVNTAEGYSFPLIQQQIADHVGLTTVHVNRVLRRLRERKMVSMQRGRVVFGDNIEELEQLAEPVQDPV